MGRRSTQEPDLGTQKNKQRKAEQATKQKHSRETTKAGQHREGANKLLRMQQGERGHGEGRRGRKRREGKGCKEKGGMLQAMPAAAWTHRGEEPYSSIQDHTKKGGGGFN